MTVAPSRSSERLVQQPGVHAHPCNSQLSQMQVAVVAHGRSYWRRLLCTFTPVRQCRGNVVMLGPDALKPENADATLRQLDEMAAVKPKAPTTARQQQGGSSEPDMVVGDARSGVGGLQRVMERRLTCSAPWASKAYA